MIWSPNTIALFCSPVTKPTWAKSLLTFYVGYHRHGGRCEGCWLRRLLQLGALVDPAGFRVTPLQIAVAARDLKGIALLLESGANPNMTGEYDGIRWGEEEILGIFDQLHGCTPLYVLRKFSAIIANGLNDLWLDNMVKTEERKIEIGNLLVKHEAEEFRVE